MKTNENTISTYIDFLLDAFIISIVQRYDIKGKKFHLSIIFQIFKKRKIKFSSN